MNNTTVCVSTDNDEDEDVDNEDDDDRGKECSFKDFEGKTKEDEHGKGEEEGMLIVEYDEIDVNNSVILGTRDDEDDFKFSFNPDASTKDVAPT